jgi:hypothetical protein
MPSIKQNKKKVLSAVESKIVGYGARLPAKMPAAAPLAKQRPKFPAISTANLMNACWKTVKARHTSTPGTSESCNAHAAGTTEAAVPLLCLHALQSLLFWLSRTLTSCMQP